MGSSSEGFSVAAKGGQILIKRVRPAGQGKIAASEFFEAGGVAKGAVLGQ